MASKPRKPSTKRNAKVLLVKASASEILSGVKVTPAEQRRAKSAVASAERLLNHRSVSEKRASVTKASATSRARVAAK